MLTTKFDCILWVCLHDISNSNFGNNQYVLPVYRGHCFKFKFKLITTGKNSARLQWTTCYQSLNFIQSWFFLGCYWVIIEAHYDNGTSHIFINNQGLDTNLRLGVLMPVHLPSHSNPLPKSSLIILTCNQSCYFFSEDSSESINCRKDAGIGISI